MRGFHTHFNYLGLALIIAALGTSQCLWADDIEIDLGGTSAAAPKATPGAPTRQPSSGNVENSSAEKASIPGEGAGTGKKTSAGKSAPKVDRMTVLSDKEGQTKIKVDGSHLPKPTVEKLSSNKILIKLTKTKLNIPAKIDENDPLVKTIRSSMHRPMTAWIVLDVIDVEKVNLSKTDTGFELLLSAKTGGKSEPVAAESTGGKETGTGENPSSTEKGLFSRLTDISYKPIEGGVKLVLTSDNPAKYTIRKLEQPEKLVLRFHNTKLEVKDKAKKFNTGDVELQKGGLISVELRQIGPSFSPISEAILTLVPGTVDQLDRNLNQVVITLSAPPPAEKAVEKKGNLNQLVSMELESADLNAVVKMLGNEAGFDVDLVSGGLSGVVNEKFKDVPLKTALADILSAGNYDYDVQGNTLRIGLRTDLIKTKGSLPHITELITPSGGMVPAQFDTLVRSIVKPSNASLSVVDPVRNVIVLNGTPSDIEDYKRAIKDLKLDASTNSDRITRVVKLNYADPAQTTAILTPYLTPVGKVQQDPRTNNLVIWETASNMGVLLELIKELDVRSPQVLIESNIVEVDDEKDLNMGINWNVHRTTGDPTLTGIYSDPSQAVNSGLFGFGTIKSGLNINATLSALEGRKKAKIISRPRVATASGVAAEINTTENVVVGTETTTITNGIATQTVAFIQLPLPIDLKVKPLITDDGRISSAVTVTVTSQTGPAVNVAGVQGPPPTSVQTANTTMTTKNGDTIVIGGLVRDTVQDNVEGIPLLSSLPIIGTLFQQKSYTHQKVELVIFITSTILED